MTVSQSAPSSPPRWLRLAAYSAWFSTCLFVSLYAMFPIGSIKQPLIDRIELSLGKGKQGRHGVDPKVQIDDMSLWGGTGVRLERVSVQLASSNPDPGPTLELDELSLRLGIFSLLFGTPSVEYNADLYGGNVSGSVAFKGSKAYEDKLYGELRALLDGKSDGVDSLEMDVEHIDLSKALFVQQKARVPLTGVLEGSVALHMGEKPNEEAKGEIDLSVKGMNLGPGELQIPVPGLTGGLSVPLVDTGDLIAKLEIDKGKGKTEKLALTGKDLQADLDVDLELNPRFSMTRVSGNGWFRIAPEFLEQNSKFKTILDFAQPLKAARDDEGRYQFHLKGTLDRPGFRLGQEKGGRGARRR